MKKTLTVLAVISIIGVAGYSLLNSNPVMTGDPVAVQDDSPSEELPNNDPTIEIEEGSLENTKETSRYIEYSPGVIEKAAGSRRVLFFYANWCPTCRPANAGFIQNESDIPEDVTVIRINYNDTDTSEEEKDLADTYDITYQHIFVQVDDEGNAIKMWSGGGLEELISKII